MEEPGKLLKSFDTLIWENIPAPVLLVDLEKLEVASANPAALKMFKLKPDLLGVTWPGVLSVINVPPTTSTKRLELNKRKSQLKPNKQTHFVKFRFRDNVSFEEKHLELTISIPPREKTAIIIINDKSAVTQSIESRADFVALASHQLRTPVSSATWNLDVFIKKYHESLSGKQNHILGNVSKSLDSMNKLIEALMSVSKIETGKLEVTPEPVKIEELISDIEKEITPALESRNMRLRVNIGKSLPKIKVDTSLVRYLFLNLIYNSIKYSKQGGEITLDLSRKDHIILTRLEDKGIGISKKYQHKIFSKFYRSPEAMKKDPDGSGLGLYLCKMIIEKFGGSIWFESKAGEGTTFWFTIPVERRAREVV